MTESDEAELISTMRLVRVAKENLLTILGDSDAGLTGHEAGCLEVAVAELDGALTSLECV